MNSLRRLMLAAALITPIAAVAQQPAAPLASQPTNWQGVTADVTEFKRKGNTVTLRMRLHNDAAKNAEAATINYDKTYLLDAAAGKKYEVLKDDKNSAIAAINYGGTGWRDNIAPGQSQLIWIKFPAPPATTKSVTLNIDNIQPFDDLAIQDVP